MLELTSGIMTLIAFGGVLWGISKLLVAILMGYALLGTALTFGVFGNL